MPTRDLTAEKFEAVLDVIRVVGSVARALRKTKTDEHAFYRYAAKVEGAREAYNQARIDGLDAVADEIIKIGETPRIGTRLKRCKAKDGSISWEAVRGDNVERAKLDSFNKMWVLSKLLPSKWGDKLTVDATVRETEAKELEQKLIDGRKRLTLVG